VARLAVFSVAPLPKIIIFKLAICQVKPARQANPINHANSAKIDPQSIARDFKMGLASLAGLAYLVIYFFFEI